MLANRWAALAVLFFARLWMGFQFQSIPPIAPLLVEGLGVNHTQVGLLIGLFMLPGIVIALPGAWLGARIGDRQVVMLGLALIGVGGLLTVWGGSFWLAAAGRVVSGTGAVALNVQLVKMVTDWFAGKELATAMGILLISWPIGIALALASLGQLGALLGWEIAMLTTVEGPAVALLLMAVFYRGAPASEPSSGSGSGQTRRPPFGFNFSELALSSTSGWVWMIYNAGFIIVISFTPAFLLERGAGIGEAGMVSSLIMWVMVGAIPLAGLLADRLGCSRLLIVLGCLGTAAATWYLTQSAAPIWLFLLLGTMMGIPAGPIMTLPGEVLAPERRGAGLGIFFTWYYIGMTIFPPIAGAIQDATGGVETTLLFAATLMVLAVVALGLFQIVRRATIGKGLSTPSHTAPSPTQFQTPVSDPLDGESTTETFTGSFTTVRKLPPLPGK